MMALFWNTILAIVWVALTDSLTLFNFILGFLVAWVILSLMQRHVPILRGHSNRGFRILSFTLYFIKELLVANVKVAYDVLTPTSYMLPGVISYRLRAKTDTEIMFFSSFLSLTPGTLLMDISDDRSTVYIHAMFLQDEEKVIADIRELESRLLRMMR